MQIETTNSTFYAYIFTSIVRKIWFNGIKSIQHSIKCSSETDGNMYSIRQRLFTFYFSSFIFLLFSFLFSSPFWIFKNLRKSGVIIERVIPSHIVVNTINITSTQIQLINSQFNRTFRSFTQNEFSSVQFSRIFAVHVPTAHVWNAKCLTFFFSFFICFSLFR